MRELHSGKHWGVSYEPKTFTFMRPQDHAIPYRWIRRALENIIPEIIDGRAGSVVKGYVASLEC